MEKFAIYTIKPTRMIQFRASVWSNANSNFKRKKKQTTNNNERKNPHPERVFHFHRFCYGQVLSPVDLQCFLDSTLLITLPSPTC